MGKESLPIISGPGILLFINISAILFYFFGFNWIIDRNKDFILILSIGSVLISPLLNIIFHPLWKIIRGYNTFGYQKNFPAKNKEEKFAINVVFDKYLYGLAEGYNNKKIKDKNNLELQIEFARRRVSSYLMYYTAEKVEFTGILAGLILLLFLFKEFSYIKLGIALSILIMNSLLFILFSAIRNDIDKKLIQLEKNILELHYGPMVKIDIKKDVDKHLENLEY